MCGSADVKSPSDGHLKPLVYGKDFTISNFDNRRKRRQHTRGQRGKDKKPRSREGYLKYWQTKRTSGLKKPVKGL